MSGASESNTRETSIGNPITFRCKFCGETKPFEELVVIRQYFPQITSCKTCSRVTPDSEQDPSDQE